MMPAGEYYIGDLCYVMTGEEWDELCALTIKDNQCLEGEFVLSDGRIFAMYSTAWGDGTYKDRRGRHYDVDSGSIGCILTSNINKKMFPLEEGYVHTFGSEFHTSGGRKSNDNWDGVIRFGSIAIETDPDEEDE